MNSKVFLGTYNKIPIYYHSKLRTGIACTTDEDGEIYDYLVTVNNLEQAIQVIRSYGQFSFEIKQLKKEIHLEDIFNDEKREKIKEFIKEHKDGKSK
jgi:hypothetical protein